MCSLSTNLDVLIFFRVVQGLMAGPLIPLSKFIIKELSTRKKNICSGIMVNDRDYRSDMWADIGRLYLR